MNVTIWSKYFDNRFSFSRTHGCCFPFPFFFGARYESLRETWNELNKLKWTFFTVAARHFHLATLNSAYVNKTVVWSRVNLSCFARPGMIWFRGLFITCVPSSHALLSSPSWFTSSARYKNVSFGWEEVKMGNWFGDENFALERTWWTVMMIECF